MKKIIGFVLLLLLSIPSWSQKYQDALLAGKKENGLSAGRFLSPPTGCGNPSAPIALDSSLKKAGMYYDSCNKRFWLYDPKLMSWDTIRIGVSGSSAVNWGTITGNLSDQTDLNTALGLRLLKPDTASMLTNYRHWLAGYVTTRDRFGFSGEDVTATANRTFTLGGYTFRLANGICKIDSTAIFGAEDETPIVNTVIGINSRTTAESFIRAWQTDVNVMRFDFRFNGDVYYSGVQVYEQANTRLQAPNALFSTKVITPLISNTQGANDLLSLAPGTSDGRVGIGVNTGADNLTDKLQLIGGFHADFTGKRMKFIGLPSTTSADSVLAKDNSSGETRWMAKTAISGGGSSAGRLVKTLSVDANGTGNEGPGEDNLMAYTIPADTLNTNGDHIEFTMAFTFAANTNGKRIRLYYGSTVIYDSGTQNQNSGSMEIRGTIVRTGTSTQLISFTSK